MQLKTSDKLISVACEFWKDLGICHYQVNALSVSCFFFVTGFIPNYIFEIIE